MAVASGCSFSHCSMTWPSVLKWIDPSSPRPRSSRLLAVGWAHLAVAPGCRETRDESGQVWIRFRRLVAPATDLVVYQVPLCVANLIQKIHRIQSSEDLAQIFLACVRNVRSLARSRSYGVAGMSYFFVTFAPWRVFDFSLNDG